MICVLGHESAAVEAELESAQRLGIPAIELALEHRVSDGSFARLEGAKTMLGKYRRYQRAYRSLADLEAAIESAVSEVFAHRWTSAATLGTFGGTVYESIAMSLFEASYRYGAAQETSILVLGPRQSRSVFETQYFDALRSRIERCLSGEADDFHLIHIFSAQRTLQAADSTEYKRITDFARLAGEH